ncbi:DUF4279 domain-containing protein [Pseudoxanthomonas composti]|uniref:DUF4279 domain-containing protein n=1 Tax=Pseudoxanthomonas composti TaxID=2137479 RepID=A0A4Q1JR97_9GAMM|nr:DUF4279 domain-containing protein [Pseudoxanthomonas composti]RXR00297.1 DUF4279 domain-containing protein [Pseudoxanthomonas composti]
MQIYSHILSIRISHSALDPDLVTRTLGLTPEVTWKAGEPRKTPKGTLLKGTRSSGYWTTDPFGYGWRESPEATVEDGLEELVSFLEPHRDYLRGIAQDGRVEIWASTQSDRNFAIELAPHMLLRIGTLGASLVHDVY